MSDLVKISVLDLRKGDRVHERNDEWPTPFTADEVYVYAVDSVDRINADTVHVGIVGADFAAAISYDADDDVSIEPR